jgi:hypothetical protein
MNVVATVTLLLLLLTTPALAAEYQDQVIDSRKFTTRVYSYETGGLFGAEVEFRGDRATIHFASGGQQRPLFSFTTGGLRMFTFLH